MKTTIYFFTTDDDGGLQTELFATEAEQLKAREDYIRAAWEERYGKRKPFPTGEDALDDAWEKLCTAGSLDSHNWGEQEIEIPDAPVAPAPQFRASITPQAPIRVFCSKCGSVNVSRDASADFNEATQAWEMGGVYDNGSCCDCECTSLVDAPISESPIAECQNCSWRGLESFLNTDIPHYHERVEPGEEEPAGECPICKALAHTVEE